MVAAISLALFLAPSQAIAISGDCQQDESQLSYDQQSQMMAQQQEGTDEANYESAEADLTACVNSGSQKCQGLATITDYWIQMVNSDQTDYQQARDNVQTDTEALEGDGCGAGD